MWYYIQHLERPLAPHYDYAKIERAHRIEPIRPAVTTPQSREAESIDFHTQSGRTPLTTETMYVHPVRWHR